MGLDPRDRGWLKSGAEQFGVSLTEMQIDQFGRYADMLTEWNARLNLTRIPPESYTPLHFLDSLAAAWAHPLREGARCIDVGTGAGFPGIPLKIAFPSVSMLLLDSMRKRLGFLDAVISELGLSRTETLHARAEEAARLPEHRERYDCVYARAVARMGTLVEWLLPLAHVGGSIVALKSERISEEMQEALGASGSMGGGIPRLESVTLPNTDIERVIVVIRKATRTPSRYPRAGLGRRAVG